MTTAQLIEELTNICERQAEIIKLQAFVLEQVKAQVREDEAAATISRLRELGCWHEEFAKRMVSENQRLADENSRQNHRIDLLEENVRGMSALATSVEKLATNMEGMVKEQERQGKRLEALEGRDGEMWRKIVGYIITAVIGIILGFIFRQIGM